MSPLEGAAGILIETAVSDRWLTPGGRIVDMAIRPGSSDWNTVNACSARHDEYHLPSGLQGWALDIGAHIGAVAVQLALDNPDLRILAVEALPENVVVLEENIRRNGVGGQVVVVKAAASHNSDPVTIGYGEESGPNSHSRFIGGMENRDHKQINVPGISLRSLLDMRGPDREEPVQWAKLDCEGCEYHLLASPSVGKLKVIEGEVHFGADRLRELLEPTHRVEVEADFGPFKAVLR